MFKRSKVSVGVLLSLGGVMALPVYAQQPAPSERVEITGSRIRSINADSPSPVQVLTAEDIAKSGAVNLQELLLKNPVLGTPAISRTNSNFSTSSAGVAVVDLRNLGTARTLVLVNGRRFVSGVPGDQAVDLNTIPTDFIERVEITTGGASSLYGSDAVAGVVNIIYKKNFEGVSVDLQGGQSTEGDDRKKKFSLTFGTTGNNGRTSLMGHLALSDQGAVFSKDRSRSAVDQISLGTQGAAASRRPEDLFTARTPFFSGFTPQGYFFTDNNIFTYNRAGAVVSANTNGAGGAEPTGFNRSEFRSIAIPTKRALLGLKAEHAITDAHSIFLEGTYAATKTSTKLEPFPLASDDILPASGGQIPAGTLVNAVLVRNPFVPDHIWNDISDTDGDGIPDYFFTRRMSEVGTRGNKADRDTVRFVTGLKGDLTKTISYDAYVGFGATKEAQTSSGQVNVLNFRYALQAIPDTNDVNGNLDRTEPICADANAREQGCVPINVFGRGAVSGAALNYVLAPGSLTTSTTQRIAGVSVNGEAFNMPAGPVGFAAGLEYRKEAARTEFDALQQAGLNAGNAIPSTFGNFDVTEAFFEGRLPLLRNMPAVKDLTAVLAVRASDYSTIGNVTSWNAGLEWTFVPGLKLRTSNSLATRAPNINELYSPPSQTFPTGLTDPCVGVTAVSVGVRDTRCRAAPGVLRNINANVSATNPNGVFVSTQADQQGISGFNLGNPRLQEEEAKSLTVGLVFNPSNIPALRDFTFTVDYFKIEIDSAIVATPRQFILNQCYNGDQSFCRFITRREGPAGPNSAGSIDLIDQEQRNSGGEGVEGIDLTVGYAARFGPGRFNSRLAYTYFKEGYRVPVPGAQRDPFAGEVGASKHRFTLDLGYTFGDFGIRTTTTYIGKAALDDQFLASNFSPSGRVPAGSVTVGAKTYLDFQVTYSPIKRTEFYFGMDNATNTKPAPVISGLPGNSTGTETDAGTYDPIGARYYAGVRVNF
jgi:iron complex outermembrane recepter protein